jgi:hypothetical protein
MALVCVASTAEAKSSKPSIVWFLTDDQDQVSGGRGERERLRHHVQRPSISARSAPTPISRQFSIFNFA